MKAALTGAPTIARLVTAGAAILRRNATAAAKAPFLLSGLGLILVYLLWPLPRFTYQAPPLWAILAGLVTLAFGAKRIPALIWAFWLWGLLTLLWSLAPGATLINGLWEILFLASFAAGRWRRGFWILNVVLLLYGLAQALLLYAWDLQMYVSGSVLYVAGAQALLLVPPAFERAVRSQRRLVAAAAGILLATSLYLALISGSRAVYLPLIVALLLSVGRLVWVRAPLRRLIIVALGVGVGLMAVDFLVPAHPMATAIGTKGSAAAQVEAVQSDGNFATRLQMYDQALGVALERPLGAGAGTYRDVIYAFQRYPYVAFASPHNYYLETLATGGWVRFALLIALLAVVLWRGWRRASWPLALGVAAYWMTTAFDITGTHASFMMLAFVGLGAVPGPEPEREAPGRARRVRSVVVAGQVVSVLLAVVLAAWWYLPCQGTGCLTERYLGARIKVAPVLQQDPDPSLLAETMRLNPASLWIYQVALQASQASEERRDAARAIAERFPYSSPEHYRIWAEAALELGERAEAQEALSMGLAHFPPGLSVVQTPLYSNNDFQEAWLAAAEQLSREIERLP